MGAKKSTEKTAENFHNQKKRKLRRNVYDFSSTFGIRFAPGGGEKKVRLK